MTWLVLMQMVTFTRSSQRSSEAAVCPFNKQTRTWLREEELTRCICSCSYCPWSNVQSSRG